MIPDGVYAGYVLNQVQNSGKARIRGVEVSYRQQYVFLPGFWGGLGAFASFNYQQAEGTFATTTFQQRLGGLAPRNANAGVSYVKHGLDVRLLANYLGKTYQSGAGVQSIYTEERLLLDFKGGYQINRTYSLFLDVINLTDEPARAWVLENNLKLYNAKQGIGFSAGIKARF